MRAWLFPEKQYAEIGQERWEVSADIVKPSAVGDEIDIDTDIQHLAWAFATASKARAYAQEVVLTRNDLAFGCTRIQKQVVDWFVEEDRICKWTDVGEAEEVT
jgi:hypothetical protein